MSELNQEFWSQRYRNNTTGWDLGEASLPITSFVDSINNKNLKILIPGAGNSYEAEYLWQRGFKNIYVLDIASEPLSNVKMRIPDLPASQIIETDFFTHYETYDLIIEQTFFCALQPQLRVAYRDHMFRILAIEGRLAGVLFDFPLSNEGPPFGGSLKEYRELFQCHFRIRTLGRCYNSEPSRAGKELFFIFDKK